MSESNFCLLVTHEDGNGSVSKYGFIKNESDLLLSISEEDDATTGVRVFRPKYSSIPLSMSASYVVKAVMDDGMASYLGPHKILCLKVIKDWLTMRGEPNKVNTKDFFLVSVGSDLSNGSRSGYWSMRVFDDIVDAQSYFDRRFHKPRKPFGKKIREAVYAKCEGHCAYCGKAITIRQMQVDHVKSFTMGGSSEITNLMPSCVLCNRCKGGDTLEWFRKYIENDAPRIHFGRKHPIDADADRICETYGLHPGKNEIKFYFEKPVVPTK